MVECKAGILLLKTLAVVAVGSDYYGIDTPIIVYINTESATVALNGSYSVHLFARYSVSPCSWLAVLGRCSAATLP